MKFSKPSFKSVLGGTVAAYCLCLLSTTAVQAATQYDDKSAALTHHARNTVVNSVSLDANAKAPLTLKATPTIKGPEAMVDEATLTEAQSAQDASRNYLQGLMSNDVAAVYNNSLLRLESDAKNKEVFSDVLDANEAFLNYADRNSGFKSFDYLGSGSISGRDLDKANKTTHELSGDISLNDEVEMVMFQVEFINNAKAYVVVPCREASEIGSDKVSFGADSAVIFTPKDHAENFLNNDLITSAFDDGFLELQFNPAY